MSWTVIVATSPFHDTSVVTGPYRSPQRIADADAELTSRGWNTEVCVLVGTDEVPEIINDEGA